MAESSAKLGVSLEPVSPFAQNVASAGFVPATTIVAAGLLAHGLLLLTDYRIWDGWEYSLWLSDESQTHFLYRLFDEIGRPLDGFFWQPFRGLQNPHLVAKATGLTAWIAHAVLMYECLRRPQFLGPSFAWAVALLAVTCPVFRPLGELTIWMNTAAVTLFWSGCYLLVRMSECRHGRWRLLARMAAIGLLFLSFNLNSHLVYFYGVIAAAVICSSAQNAMRVTARSMLRLGCRYPDLILLPVVFWLWKCWFTPTHGAYVDYNRPSLSPLILSYGYWVLFRHLLVPLFAESFKYPEVVAASGVAATLLARFLWTSPKLAESVSLASLRLHPLNHGLAAGVLLVAASFAYISVGQFVAYDPWLARNNILTPLAISLAVVCGMASIGSVWLPQRKYFWLVACLTVCCMWAAFSNLGYLRLQAFGVKQLSIQQHLKEVIRTHDPAVIQICDYVELDDGIPYYPPLIWTAMAACCGTSPRALIFQLPTEDFGGSRVARRPDPATTVLFQRLTPREVESIITETTVPYALAGIPTAGTRVVLAVHRTRNSKTSTQIGLEYLTNRWLSPDQGSNIISTYSTAELVEIDTIASAVDSR